MRYEMFFAALYSEHSTRCISDLYVAGSKNFFPDDIFDYLVGAGYSRDALEHVIPVLRTPAALCVERDLLTYCRETCKYEPRLYRHEALPECIIIKPTYNEEARLFS
ncbi:hypothetical protein GUITHDRAFT_103671 [Guillardia theta CCMP2712]|uniref:Uncharacterized protein n=1 Tax=Guillardia theta (strain CCMP2712) TaxID=905079 RepID=L1JPR3_GUITC|nr:hypothetical protein GUITHDRAFT_103671 [Guillardia theta CCMP2712]EKX50437.1 hypothetical protein GUITHDRAFT_103671 [Guillardia theta CCMP2712]|eukprot:XP_005837417.1 hypothetical protein GUITHDRAFT_103671 [Guillardia theta CCMP2712]